MAAAATMPPQPLHPSRTVGGMVPGHTSPAPLPKSIVAPAVGPTTPAGPCSAVPGGCQLRKESGAEDESRSHAHHAVEDPLRFPLGGPPRRLLIFPLLHTPQMQPHNDQSGCWCCCCDRPPRFATTRSRAVGSLLAAPPPPSPPAQALPWYSRLTDDCSTPRPRASHHPLRPIHHHLPSSRVPSVPWQHQLVLSSPSALFSQEKRPAALILPSGAAAGGWWVGGYQWTWLLEADGKVFFALSLSLSP